jgi:uncharacterized protein (TIGR02598 family)
MYLLHHYFAASRPMNKLFPYCARSHSPAVEPNAASKCLKGNRGGFSLVEVVLAIGVVAFAFVAIFALLPTGMNTFRQAMDTSVGAQIAQRIAGELQESDYYDLLKQTKPAINTLSNNPDEQHGLLPRRYFDDQGNEIRVDNPEAVTNDERLKILYEVSVRVSRASQVPMLTNGSSGRLNSQNLATLTIQVANNPAGVPLKFSPDLLLEPNAQVPFITYPAMLARNGSTP